MILAGLSHDPGRMSLLGSGRSVVGLTRSLVGFQQELFGLSMTLTWKL